MDLCRPCRLSVRFHHLVIVGLALALPVARPAVAAENKWAEAIAAALGIDPSDLYGYPAASLLHQTTATTTYYLYPNACNDRYAGTWTPQSSLVADSLNSYSVALQDHGYQLTDLSLKEHLWHVSDGSDSPDVGTGLSVNGSSRWLWCGKYDAGWVVRSGYPNTTYQILYIDTDLNALNGGAARTGPYTLSWQENVSTESDYDFVYVIGGGSGGGANRDPIGNSRALLDAVIANGTDSGNELLVQMTGSQVANQTLSYSTGNPSIVSGNGSGAPANTSWSLSGVPAEYRGIYFVFVSDQGFSGEDGLWPEGHGAVLDNLTANDQPGGTGNLYAEQTTAGGTDPYGGDILVSVNSMYAISARVPAGVGTVWTIQAGSQLPTSDYCSPQKGFASDHMFLGGDAGSKLTVAGEYASVRTCTFPLPSGTASVVAVWGEYVDLPRGSGFTQMTEFRYWKDGAWSDWVSATPGRSERAGSIAAWTVDWADLAEATQADSIQLGFTIECIPFAAVDHVNCQAVQYGVLYDDLRLQITTGSPAPVFRIFPGALAQSTFVDGTDPTSAGCSAGQISSGQCWPGVRGSNVVASAGPIHDNWNAPIGDSITVTLASGLRSRGMGINWQYGFDKSVLDGKRIARLNGAYNASYGAPAWIYRIYDPATQVWSPWDSSALDANSAAISGPDTVVVDSDYRLDWPPRDKYYVNQGGADIGPSADADLPGAGGGWSLNGHTKYSQVPFLPRGTRVQYYLKAVDIDGGVSYQFGGATLGLETEDLPTLPGGSIQAPDVIEFDVLPRVYPPGAGGSLVAGRTDTKLLNLDGAYSVWSNGFDPVTQALRAMGVRADRYRLLQGLSEGSNVGGHEYAGARVSRLGSYFPNDQEYGVKDLLAGHYNIVIQSSHVRDWPVWDEADARLVDQWWLTDTGVNGGDRCVFVTGDDMFNGLLNASKSFPQYTEEVNLAQSVFGVAACIGAWTYAATVPYPTIDDRFAGGGPGLAAPNTYTYPLDGGCPGPNRFDGLTKVGSSDAQNAVFYPGGVTEVAGIARMSENDPSGSLDNDRNKALAYGFSIQFIRTAGISPAAANYPHSGVENRMRVLYKFLTSCRTTAAGTTPCWPCPSNPAEMSTNWATATGFDTGTYGGLFPIQDYTQATGVPEEGAGVPRFVNALSQNRPNPFNPETLIPYSLASDGRVAIRIFDVAGRLTRTLVDAKQRAGPHAVRWDGRGDRGTPLASGIYFYTIRYPDGAASARKMTILR